MSAVFSDEAIPFYRYRLDRELEALFERVIAMLLHNPSTADGLKNDPTSKRSISFADALEGSRLVMVNPWAGIATEKPDLWRMDDPVGPLNDSHIEAVAREVVKTNGVMIAGWGIVKPPRPLRQSAAARIARVLSILADCRCPLHAFHINADGSPKHPLYVAANQSLTRFR